MQHGLVKLFFAVVLAFVGGWLARSLVDWSDHERQAADAIAVAWMNHVQILTDTDGGRQPQSQTAELATASLDALSSGLALHFAYLAPERRRQVMELMPRARSISAEPRVMPAALSPAAVLDCIQSAAATADNTVAEGCIVRARVNSS
ncbi:MAG: hypothetical protein M0Q42_07720 [Xanthomonadales bacterium]|nr:hypothetical protein [Xanthomonadales bacterium]